MAVKEKEESQRKPEPKRKTAVKMEQQPSWEV